MKQQRKKDPWLFIFAIAFGFIAASLYSNWSFSGSDVEIYRSTVEAYADKFNVDPALLMSVIRSESSGNPKAISHAGAIGLMQIMPETAKTIAKLLGEPVPGKTELMEPERNIRFGACYFGWLQEQFGVTPEVLLAAYNAGPTRVYKWLSANQDKDAVSIVRNCPIDETRFYIARTVSYLGRERENYGRR
ncbi:MAG: lytic transglycosylase domain-containing protein [Candidatus Brocadiia bacterium]